ncbi:MAG: hypothetical protein FD153_2038 [Rhodospirillaceae bacterium]|nr:MAG: hypothetical protein FD153_2038 [Rhodospirillaceae bacterium]
MDWFDGSSQGIENIPKEEAARFGAGRVHIISLADFRTALGNRWQRLSSEVMLIGRGVIQRHMGPEHLHSQQGEDTFLLIFRAMHPHEAKRRTILIANALGHRLVGAAFSDLDAQIRVADIEPARLLKEDGTIDVTALAEVVATGKTVALTVTGAAAAMPRISGETPHVMS